MASITSLAAANSVAAADQLVINQSGTDRRVSAGKFALTEQANTFTAAQVMPALYSAVALLNDDAAMSWTPAKAQGILFLFNRYKSSGHLCNAIIPYSVVDQIYTVILSQPSDVIVARTGALTGTTGTDGKISVSAHTDGKLYIENRSGYAWYYGYLVVGG